MDFTSFLSSVNADRATRTLGLLRRNSIAPFVLAGGLAVELHRMHLGLPAEERPLNDMDFLVDSFDEIPSTLSANLNFRHVHPHDPPARTLLQCVDPATAVRVDIFRASLGTTASAISINLCGATMRMISNEDVLARTARLCMDLAVNAQLPAKHARDFLRLLSLADSGDVEPAWQEHRKPDHPGLFASSASLLRDLIATRKDLQIEPAYSKDVLARCSRCVSTDP